MKPIPFSKISINRKETRAIKSALCSGWLTSGPQCTRFEEEFAASAGAQYAVSVNSATAGIFATLLALGCGSTDHLFVSPYTYTASVAPAISLGMKVHFIDIEPDSFNIDTERLASALHAHFKTEAERRPKKPTSQSASTAELRSTKHAKKIHKAHPHPQTPNSHKPKTIIMAVHVGGRICDMKTINQLADKFGCTVIEDAAHGQPLYGEGGAIGLRGHYTIFSFYPNKPICAAEGGMVITDLASQAQAIRVVKNQGIDRTAWNRHQQISNPHANWWEYNVVTQGGKLNLSELHAAIGRVQLHKSRTFLERRSHIAQLYRMHLGDCSDIMLPAHTHNHSWHLYQVLIDSLYNRADIMHYLKTHHIETSVHYKPLTLMPYYQQHPSIVSMQTPLAHERWQRTISLPIYHGLKNRQIHYIATSLKRALQQSQK